MRSIHLDHFQVVVSFAFRHFKMPEKTVFYLTIKMIEIVLSHINTRRVGRCTGMDALSVIVASWQLPQLLIAAQEAKCCCRLVTAEYYIHTLLQFLARGA